MAAQQTSEGQDTKVYYAKAGDTAFTTLFSTTGSASPTPAEAAGVDAAEAKAFGVAAQLVGEVTAIGDQNQASNTREYPVYGSPTRRKRATPTSIDDVTFAVAVDRTDSKHKEIMDSAIGTYMVFVLVTTTSATNITYDVISGELAGKNLSRPVEEEATLTVTIAPAVAPYYLDEA